MFTVRDIREREKEGQRRTFEAFHNDLPAVIKSVDGLTRPANQTSMTWVSILNQPESRVLVHNATTLDVEGTPVWVGPEAKPPYRLEVKGLYFGGLSQASTSQAAALQVGAHAQVHQYPSESSPGPDKVLIFQYAWQPLKMTGTGANLTVTVQPQYYIKNGRPAYFPGANIDLTTSVPSVASTQRRTLVYLDETINLISVVDGATVPTGGALTPSYPNLPINGRASGYVLLINGQTTIATASDVEDWRDLGRARDNLSGATVSPHLSNFTLETEIDTSVSGAISLDFIDGNVQEITLTGNTSITIINPPSTNKYGEMKIIIHQDSTGGYTVTWPMEVWWPGSSTPTMSTAADAADVYELFTTNGGYYYFGRALAAYGPSNISITVNTLILASSTPSMSVLAVTTISVNTLTLAGTAVTSSVT